MIKEKNTVVLVLKSGGDFSFSDVELLAHHLHAYYSGEKPLEVVCLCDKVTQPFALKNCTLIPMPYPNWKGWWSKLNLFAPEMEQYRPFLYIDLDTAIVGDYKELFLQNETEIAMLSDFYRNKEPASGVMWIPSNNQQVKGVWESWVKEPENHMKKYCGDQNFISNFILSNIRWQAVTNLICSFKVRKQDRSWLQEIPEGISVVCFHGHPRIREAVSVPWVFKYIKQISL